MEDLLSPERLFALVAQARDWFAANVLVTGNLVQIFVIGAAFAISWYVAPRLLNWLRGLNISAPNLRRVLQVLASITRPLIWLTLQWVALIVAAGTGWPQRVLVISMSLLTAWILIRLLSSFAAPSGWTRLITWGVWTIAALNILNLLDPAIALLDAPAFTIGELRVSPYSVLKAMIALALLLWVASYLGSLLETRIRTSETLSPSLKVLITKLLKIALLTIAILVVIETAGIGVTSLTVLGGAIGLGIGIGLQKVFSNLVSGLILLLDKSIKPGDVIAIKGTYGWVNTLGGRYVSVITRDGVEHLIPNELLITEYVENWTHTDNNVRLKIPIGVHYKSNVRKAIELCLEAAQETPRVLAQPAPTCLLRDFGDSAVKLEIRIWVNDPANGISNVRSDVMLKVWDKFHDHGIEIPYPQRDVHMHVVAHAPAELPP